MVADFGIARAVADVGEEALTTTGLAVGTPEYMSPEQGSGDHDLDRRSDVYALGCVLYEMLAGQPPFTGRTAQVVLARHRQDTPPSLRVVRPAMPAGLEQAVETALAKIPADRFATAAEFAAALEATTHAGPALPARLARRSRGRLATAIGLAAVAAGAAWWTVASRARAPDPNKIMVYPLVEHAQAGPATGAGEAVAIMIGRALEHTEPLKWLDGWNWLEPDQRTDVRSLSARSARTMALSQGARYYIDGSLVRNADSATVVLRLHDNVGDSIVGQSSASAASASAAPAQLGLRAAAELLPALVQPGRRPDPAALTALASRAPAAIANWLQGEREYRQSHFGAALAYYRRAVEADSLLAFAALRGAEAAWWMVQEEQMDTLGRMAVAHASALPPKYAALAHGLERYLVGDADSAVALIRTSIRADSGLSASWMMLGEVYYHLFPTAPEQTPLALAEAAFVTARRVDPGFTPPLYHLTELALRRADFAKARQYLAEYRASGADAGRLEQVGLMVQCAEKGLAGAAWRTTAARAPVDVLLAAKSLSGGGYFPACAIAGFRAVLDADSASPSARWGAVMGLQGMLVAQGQPAAAGAVLDSAVGHGTPAAQALFVLDALAGGGLEARANTVMLGLAGDYSSMSSGRLWYLGAWAAHQGEAARLDSITRSLADLAARSGAPDDRLVARVMAAHLLLLRADPARAIGALAALRPSASNKVLTWGFWEALGGERLALAALLEARGRHRDALRVADEFDHPDPVTYLLYLPASLRLRARAARGLGDEALAVRYEQRLMRLAGSAD